MELPAATQRPTTHFTQVCEQPSHGSNFHSLSNCLAWTDELEVKGSISHYPRTKTSSSLIWFKDLSLLHANNFYCWMWCFIKPLLSFFWYFFSCHCFLLCSLQWAVASQNEWGDGKGSGTVCAFDGLTDMQTLILLAYAQQAFSCVSTAIIVVTINLMVLKVQGL